VVKINFLAQSCWETEMASLRQRAGGWDLRYRDLDGRERTERFVGEPGRRKPPEEAIDRKAKVERELRRSTYVTREERQATFGEYFDQWWAARRVSATRTYTDTQRARDHVLPYWRTRRLCDIRPSDVDDWIAKLSTKMGGESVRHCYTLLRGPIRRAVKDGIITDPLIDVVLPAKKKIAKNFDDVLSGAEVRRLVEAMIDPEPQYAGLRTNDRYQAMILAGCWLGPRWNEILGIRVCDVNPLRHEIVFGRVVVNENATTFVEEGNKTEEHRTVPVPASVMINLVEHISRYCPAGDREAFLFLTVRGRHPTRSNFSRRVLQPALKRASLGDRRITWLSLRHTAASLMFDAGLTIFDVQRRLGHHSPVLTQEIYTHLMRERYDEGRKTMEDYIRRVME
jgi:integrase